MTSRGGIGSGADGGISARPSTAGWTWAGDRDGSVEPGPTRWTSTRPPVEHVGVVLARCPRPGRRCRPGPRRAAARCARTRVPLPTSTRSPSPMPERGGVDRRELGDLAGADELQRGREVDLLGRPQRAVGAEPQALPSPAAGSAGGTSSLAGSQAGDSNAVALGPAHAAAADLLERDARCRTARPRTAACETCAPVRNVARIVAERARDVGDDLPQRRARRSPAGRRGRAGWPIAGPQPLQAPVGMRERAFLLGIGLGGEDDVGVLAHRLGQLRLDGDHGLRGAERAVPQRRGSGSCAAGRRGAARSLCRSPLARPSAMPSASRPGAASVA